MGEPNITMSVSVLLFVRLPEYPSNHTTKLHQMYAWCLLPVAMARSSSGGVGIRKYFRFYDVIAAVAS